MNILPPIIIASFLATQQAHALLESLASDHPAGTLFATNTNDTEGIILPLETTDVDLEVTAGVVHATVTQTFFNPTPNPLEAIYVFPLPARASVTDMELRLDDRVIRSIVQERKQAKKTYEAAKAAGKKTALLEQERPNIFTTSVANFGPGDRVSIRFRYLENADYQKGRYSVRFPMVVGQRFIPLRTQELEDGSVSRKPAVEDASRLNPPLLPPGLAPRHRLRLCASISGLPVKDIRSNTHAIDVKRPETEDAPVEVRLRRDAVIANADFNMDILLRESPIPRATFLEANAETEHYGMLTVFPPTEERRGSPPPPRDVVFLIDTSGSMSGESIGQARSGLSQCLDMLRPEDRFSVVRFASDYSFFAPDFRPATHDKLRMARNYVDGLSAEGGTEMHPALDYALSLKPAAGHLKLLIFLTDGDVGNEEELSRLLEAKLGRTRLFAFAIGSAPNEYLIRTMAEQGRGQARFIRSHEDIDTEMSDFFLTLERPVLTDVQLSWYDPSGKLMDQVVSYPSPCPDVFSQRPLQVIAASPSPFSGTVVVEGRVDGNPVRYALEASPHAEERPALAKLYGGAEINKLMLDHLRAETPEQRGIVRDAIIETALRHQLVSKFTSRVAVEEQVTTQADGTLTTVKVKVPLPRGWDPSNFHATATQDSFFLLIGAALLLGGFLLRRPYARGRT